MPIKKVTIPNISCGHCVMAVKNEAEEINGVSLVEGNPETKEVTFTWDEPATWEQIAAAIKDAGYPAAE
jgi:copper chaperone